MVCVVLAFGLAFAGQAFGLFELEFFGTKRADIERNIFEQSQSYRHGTIRDLRNLQMEYVDAEAGTPQRKVIRSTVIHQAGAVDRDELPADLRQFIEQLEQK